MKILIGYLSNSIKGAIPTITKIFVDNISTNYILIPFYIERNLGRTKHAKINILNLYYLLAQYIKWIYLILKHKPDAVHYPLSSFWKLEKTLLFLITAKIFKVKTIAHLHGGAFKNFWSNLSPIRKKYSFFFLTKIDFFIVLSVSWKESMINDVKLDKNKIHIVHNPIEEDFDFYFKNKEISIKNENNILCIGVLDSQKGVFDIIEAGKLLLNKGLDIKFLLVGPEREHNIYSKCNSMIKENNLERNIIITGPVYNEEKLLLYENAKLLLLPSYFENLPLVIIEAACAGLPIISTPIGSIPDFFIDNESIYYIEMRNPKSIQEAVTQLLSKSEKRNVLAKNAKIVYEENFSIPKVINQLEEVYNKLEAVG